MRVSHAFVFAVPLPHPPCAKAGRVDPIALVQWFTIFVHSLCLCYKVIDKRAYNLPAARSTDTDTADTDTAASTDLDFLGSTFGARSIDFPGRSRVDRQSLHAWLHVGVLPAARCARAACRLCTFARFFAFGEALAEIWLALWFDRQLAVQLQQHLPR